jgi:hypothetical protein
MRHVSLLALVAYLAVLSYGLLSPDPFQIAGEHGIQWRSFYFEHVEPIGHWIAFAPLGFLGCVSDWPLRRITRFGLLVCYALASEGLQHFLPPRTVDWRDLVQNLAGLVTGAAVWWLMRWMWRGRATRAERSSAAADFTE